jgi:hypothetical protein
MPDGDYLVAGEQADLDLLAPLLAVHAQSHPVRLLPLDGRESPGRGWWRQRLDGVAAVLRLGDPALGAQAALPGAVLRDASNRPVAAGWLPREPERVRA